MSIVNIVSRHVSSCLDYYLVTCQYATDCEEDSFGIDEQIEVIFHSTLHF